MSNSKIEKRIYDVTFRTTGDEHRTVSGHAAVFNKYSNDMGGWVEMIEPGAFTHALNVSDVRALFNHEASHLLGRTTSGTLILRQDDQGLFYELTLPKHRGDIVEMLERRDLTQNSFAFTVKDARWEQRDGMDVRIISSFERLYDISLVTYPGYNDTDVALRSFQEYQKAKTPELVEVPDYSLYEQLLTLNKHTL